MKLAGSDYMRLYGVALRWAAQRAHGMQVSMRDLDETGATILCGSSQIRVGWGEIGDDEQGAQEKAGHDQEA